MNGRHFDPNQLTFDQGLERIQRAVKQTGLNVDGRIVTSRDADVARLTRVLGVTNVPEGFRKWQLPVYMSKPSQLYITVAEPGARVGEHSHDEGEGMRFIVSGSVIYKDTELTAGDWMFMPAGAKYSIQIGRLGAVMCYCYCCSCAGAELGLDFDEIVDPMIPG